jgi:hypothetical protein
MLISMELGGDVKTLTSVLKSRKMWITLLIKGITP